MNKLISEQSPISYKFHQKHHGSNFYYFTSISTSLNSTISPVRYSFSTSQTTSNSAKSLVARYYEPSTAQFVTQDPMLAQTDQAYSYAGGNPVNSWDPSGMWPWGGLCIHWINCGGGSQSIVGSWLWSNPKPSCSKSTSRPITTTTVPSTTTTTSTRMLSTNYDWANLVLEDGGWPTTQNNITVMLDWMASEQSDVAMWWTQEGTKIKGT